jgi:beta-glucosidase
MMSTGPYKSYYPTAFKPFCPLYPCYVVVDALKAGKLDKDDLIKSVSPLFYTRMRLGEFDPPQHNPYSFLDLSVIQSEEHRAISLTAAMKSFVLLKNKDGFLPIRKKYNTISVGQYCFIVQ